MRRLTIAKRRAAHHSMRTHNSLGRALDHAALTLVSLCQLAAHTALKHSTICTGRCATSAAIAGGVLALQRRFARSPPSGPPVSQDRPRGHYEEEQKKKTATAAIDVLLAKYAGIATSIASAKPSSSRTSWRSSAWSTASARRRRTRSARRNLAGEIYERAGHARHQREGRRSEGREVEGLEEAGASLFRRALHGETHYVLNPGAALFLAKLEVEGR
jgi:hypothetical protein